MSPIAVLNQIHAVLLRVHLFLAHDELNQLNMGVNRVATNIITKVMHGLLTYYSVLLLTIEVLLKRIFEYPNDVDALKSR